MKWLWDYCPISCFASKAFFSQRIDFFQSFGAFFFDEEASNKLTKATPKSYKEVQQGFGSSSSYKPSKCSKFLTTGGETPRHTWQTLLQWANRASSCATLLKSRFSHLEPNPIKPKISNGAHLLDSNDKLSNLPQHVLHYILSCLDTREIICLSIL